MRRSRVIDVTTGAYLRKLVCEVPSFSSRLTRYRTRSVQLAFQVLIGVVLSPTLDRWIQFPSAWNPQIIARLLTNILACLRNRAILVAAQLEIR